MIISGIILILLGIIAVPTLFLPYKWAGKISSVRGYIGIAAFIIGIAELILYFSCPGLFAKTIFLIIGIISSFSKINLGAMLGFNTPAIKRLFRKIAKNGEESSKDVEFILFKTMMSIIGIGIGFTQIIISLF